MEVGRLVVGDERCRGGVNSGEGITSGAGVVGGVAVVGSGGAGAVGCVAVRDGLERGGRPQPRPAPGERTVARALSDDPRRGLAVRRYADRGAHAGIAAAASGTAGTDLVGTPLRVRLDSGVAAPPRPAIHRRPRAARRSTLVGADDVERFRGYHHGRHRPDIVGAAPSGSWIPIEVELQQKSLPRLRGILSMYGAWRIDSRIGGVMYVCGDQDGADRIRRSGARIGWGDRLRIELLETITAQAIEACEQMRAARKSRSADELQPARDRAG